MKKTEERYLLTAGHSMVRRPGRIEALLAGHHVESRAGSSDRPPKPEDDFERAQELCQDAESAMLAGVLMFGA
jgi:hypothetical protein